MKNDIFQMIFLFLKALEDDVELSAECSSLAWQNG